MMAEKCLDPILTLRDVPPWVDVCNSRINCPAGLLSSLLFLPTLSSSPIMSSYVTSASDGSPYVPER